MKKNKAILSVIGILFAIAAIGFFIARNEAVDTAARSASDGGFLVYTYTRYAKYFGIAAYSFLVISIPCLIIGFCKNRKEDKA